MKKKFYNTKSLISLKSRLFFLPAFLILLSSFFTNIAYGQCTNAIANGSVSAFSHSNGIFTITTCADGGEYGTINDCIAGKIYEFTSLGLDRYLTVRQGTPGGTVLGSGISPLLVVCTVSGPLFLHINSDSLCGVTSSACITTLGLCVSCKPLNDSCDSPININNQVNCFLAAFGSTYGATTDDVGFCTTDSASPGVWYKFIGNGDSLIVSTCNINTNFDTHISVFSGTCGAITCVTENDNDPTCPHSGLHSEVKFLTTLNTPYLIFVNGTESDTGEFHIKFYCRSACTGLNPTITGEPIFCDGDSTLLDAGSHAGYSWSTGETSQSITVNTTGIFTVTVTNASGCTGSTSVTTTVNSLPVPSISGATSFCAGSSTNLDAGAFAGYSWSTGETSQSITVNTTGIFTVTVTNASGCTGSTSVTTTVNSLPVPSISGATSFCVGSSTNLDAGAFADYSWSTGETSQSITVNTTGIFTVTVTDDNGCTAATSIGVSQSTLAANCSGTNPTCGNADGTAAVTVIGGVPPYSYLWSNNSTDSTITGLSAGTYTVTVTDAFGCTDTCSVALINGGSSITPTISCNAAFCAGKSTVLDAGAGYIKYKWSTGATTRQIIVTTANTFTVTVTDANGCTGSTSVTTIVYPLPVVSFSGLPSSCNVSAGPSTLTGSPSGGTFSGKGISGNKFYPNVAGIGGPYTITYTYTNYNGCTKSITHQISVTGTCYTPSLPGAISGPASGVCKQTAVQYAVPYVSGVNFQWSFNTSYATITSGQGTNSITVKFLSSFTSGILSVKASNNCGTSLAKTLSIVAAPAKPGSITGVSSVCKNKQNVAYSIVAVNGATNYTWTGPTGSKIKDGLYISSGNSYNTSSTSIKVNFGTYAGNVQVKANNQCGSSSASTKYVSISCRESFDNASAASATLSTSTLSTGAQGDFDVLCYPVPASDELNVSFQSEQEAAISIRIFDVLGKSLLEQNNYSTMGENKFMLDVSTISIGIYMIEVVNGDQKSIQKIIIK